MPWFFVDFHSKLVSFNSVIKKLFFKYPLTKIKFSHSYFIEFVEIDSHDLAFNDEGSEVNGRKLISIHISHDNVAIPG